MADRLVGKTDVREIARLTPLADAGAKLAGFAAGLSDAQKQALSVSAGLASLSGLAAAGATIASVISSFTGLAASANVASAASTRMAGGSALGTATSAAGGMAAGAAGSRAASILGGASKGLGWLSLGALFGPTLWDEIGKEAAGTDDAKGGGLQTIGETWHDCGRRVAASTRIWLVMNPARLIAISPPTPGSVGAVRLANTFASLARRRIWMAAGSVGRTQFAQSLSRRASRTLPSLAP